MRKPALVALGCLLVFAGVVLGILPVVPGTPIVLFGALMVSNHSARGRLLRQRARVWGRPLLVVVLALKARLAGLYSPPSRPARESAKS